jgi:hypothetical protein
MAAQRLAIAAKPYPRAMTHCASASCAPRRIAFGMLAAERGL